MSLPAPLIVLQPDITKASKAAATIRAGKKCVCVFIPPTVAWDLASAVGRCAQIHELKYPPAPTLTRPLSDKDRQSNRTDEDISETKWSAY